MQHENRKGECPKGSAQRVSCQCHKCCIQYQYTKSSANVQPLSGKCILKGRCLEQCTFSARLLPLLGLAKRSPWWYNENRLPKGIRPFFGASFVIPHGVTSIARSAFKNCERLVSVTIPDSVTDIDEFAFRACESLTSVTIPDSVSFIDGSAFENCESLVSVTIPDSVRGIELGAFRNCEKLTSVTIGRG